MTERVFPLLVEGLKTPLKMLVHDERDQHVSKGIAENGVWEVYESQLVIERLQAGEAFIDVGANIGYYSVLASQWVGEAGRIYGFEPDPNNFSLFEANVALNKLNNVECFNVALSNCDNEGALYLNDSNFGDHQIYDNGDGRDSFAIQLRNGSTLLSSVENIRLVKIATPGAEYQVLSGLLPLLKKQAGPLSLIVEFWPYGLKKSGSSATQLLDLLLSLQLPLSIIDHLGHSLVACTEQQLRSWVAMMAEHPEDEGFMNILVGS
mgnify:FL=1